MENKKWYNSSWNHNKISLTIKGAATSIIPIIVFVTGYFGLDLTPTDLMATVNAFLEILAGIAILIGLVRKIFVKLSTK